MDSYELDDREREVSWFKWHRFPTDENYGGAWKNHLGDTLVIVEEDEQYQTYMIRHGQEGLVPVGDPYEEVKDARDYTRGLVDL